MRRIARRADDVLSWFAHRADWTIWIVITVIVVAWFVAVASGASAATLTGPWYAQRAAAEMHAPVVPGQVVLLEPCPGWPDLAACNFPTADSPIYIKREFYSRVALARELGGRFDALAMTPAARWHFMAIMRYHGPWWDGPPTWGIVDIFEDAYADCALGIPRVRPTLQDPESRWVDGMGYDPSPKQHKRVCALINRTGLRAGLRPPSG